MVDGDTKLVTVAVPCYNHAKYVEESIKSVIAQSYPRIELIIIDDGSSDDCAARIRKMTAECRARFVRFEFRSRENKGLCNTLNEALAWSQGEYFVIADSDDVLLPEHTATLVQEIEGDAGTNGVFGGGFVIDDNGCRTGIISPRERRYKFSDILARDKNMLSSCGILRTDAMRRAGGYLDGLFIEDWFMMLKLSEDGSSLRTISTPLILYRLHPTNISKSVQRMLGARLQILDMFSHYPGAPARKALVHVEGAIDVWRVSRFSSINHLITALKLYPAIAMHPLYRAAIMRIFTPTAITDLLKRRKDRKGRQAATA